MTTTDEQRRLDEHERRLDDHDVVLKDIRDNLSGVLVRLDRWAKYALVIGVAIASGTKGGSGVIDTVLGQLVAAH